MELNSDSEHHMMIGESPHESMQIDPGRARFPRCIVWSPLPVISWFIPFIGHVGICREDGVILDFAGPNFVCIDNFTFGSATRYIQISKDKCSISTYPSIYEEEEQSPRDEYGREISPWDYALHKGTQEFQHHSYNLFTCNCHSFVANNLNRLGFHSGGWNVVNLAALVFFKGQWVSKGAVVRSLLPFGVVFVLGLLFGGSTFLIFWAFFIFLLAGWFLLVPNTSIHSMRSRAAHGYLMWSPTSLHATRMRIEGEPRDRESFRRASNSAMAAEEGQVISCHTLESWTEHIQKSNAPGKLVVVDFTASWCGPCRFIAPFLAELARRFPSVLFLKVDVDELKTVAQEWAVEAMPTFMFVKEGKIVDKVVGARKGDLEGMTVKHMSATASA